MRKIRIALFTFVQTKPLQFKVAMLLAGMLAGLIDSWYITKDAMQLSSAGMLILLLVSTITYTIMLTLYRILQKTFRLGAKLPGDIQQFDEREIFRTVGLFGLVPFGVTIQLLSSFSDTQLSGFASIIFIQGFSFFLGARISQVIKK